MSVLCTWKLCLTKYIGPSQQDGAVSSAQKGAFFAKKRGTSYQQNMSLCKDAPWFAILPKSFLAERCLWSRPSARSTAGHNGTKPSSAVELQSAGKTGNLALAATCQGYSRLSCACRPIWNFAPARHGAQGQDGRTALLISTKKTLLFCQVQQKTNKGRGSKIPCGPCNSSAARVFFCRKT